MPGNREATTTDENWFRENPGCATKRIPPVVSRDRQIGRATDLGVPKGNVIGLCLSRLGWKRICWERDVTTRKVHQDTEILTSRRASTHDVGVIEVSKERVGPSELLRAVRAKANAQLKMNVADVFDHVALQDTAAAGAVELTGGGY